MYSSVCGCEIRKILIGYNKGKHGGGEFTVTAGHPRGALALSRVFTAKYGAAIGHLYCVNGGAGIGGIFCSHRCSSSLMASRAAWKSLLTLPGPCKIVRSAV